MAEQPNSFDPEALGVADLGGFVRFRSEADR